MVKPRAPYEVYYVNTTDALRLFNDTTCVGWYFDDYRGSTNGPFNNPVIARTNATSQAKWDEEKIKQQAVDERRLHPVSIHLTSSYITITREDDALKEISHAYRLADAEGFLTPRYGARLHRLITAWYPIFAEYGGPELIVR